LEALHQVTSLDDLRLKLVEAAALFNESLSEVLAGGWVSGGG